jgi:hypothetical protein
LPGNGGVTAGEQIAVPAHDRVRADQQPQPPQHGTRQRMQQGGQQRPVDGLQADALITEVALQHGELVA